jgi:recombinational DNA repair protein (RecF pathway)
MLSRLVLSRQSVQESRQILVHFIQHLLGRELKSMQVLKQLRQLGAIGGNTY